MSERESSSKAGIWTVAAILLVIAAGVVAFWNSFDGVFVWDDTESIRDNYHIRHVWPPSEALSLDMAAAGATVSGRPVLSASFALNRALLGPDPWGYHLVNLMIHISGGLLLLGIVRRTIRRAGACSPNAATAIGLAVTLLWLVHPLATASVTYMVQRAESLTGCLLLLTLYAAIRAFERPSETSPPIGWYALSIAACMVGMGVKQSMFAAPLLVLCYDAVFVSGGFKTALVRRRGFYSASAFSWVLLGLLTAWWQMSDPNPELGARPIWPYALTQPGVILYYLRLVAWPDALVADYSWPMAEGFVAVVIPTAVIVVLLAATVWGLARRHWLGFAGAWFFLILAPSSSFTPLEQRMQAQRMYLPLAAVAAVVVVGAWYLLRRLRGGRLLAPVVGGPLVVAIVAALTWGTIQRNAEYHDLVVFWRDNAQARPRSFVALTNLGEALRQRGELTEAVARLTEAAELSGPKAEVFTPLAIALKDIVDRAPRSTPEDYEPAAAYLQQAQAADPDYAPAYNALGIVRVKQGRRSEARDQFLTALERRSDYVEAMNNLGATLVKMGRPAEAVPWYEKALSIRPDYPSALANLGEALLRLKRVADAEQRSQAALALDPNSVDAHYNLAEVALARKQPLAAARHVAVAADLLARKHDYASAASAATQAASMAASGGDAAFAAELSRLAKRYAAALRD